MILSVMKVTVQQVQGSDECNGRNHINYVAKDIILKKQNLMGVALVVIQSEAAITTA